MIEKKINKKYQGVVFFLMFSRNPKITFPRMPRGGTLIFSFFFDYTCLRKARQPAYQGRFSCFFCYYADSHQG